MNGTENITHSFDVYVSFGFQLFAALLGAGTGAYFGFHLARKWERRKDQEDVNKKKIHTVESIVEELRVMKENLDTEDYGNVRWSGQDKKFYGYYGTVSRPAYDSAISSGNFSLLPSKIQTKIADVYLTMQTMYDYNIQIRKFYSSSTYTTNNLVNDVANELADQSNKQTLQFHRAVNEVIPELEEELKNFQD